MIAIVDDWKQKLPNLLGYNPKDVFNMDETGLFFWQSKNKTLFERGVQNDKNICLSHSTSQEPYMIWLSLLVHKSKMMISPSIFFFFSKFWFFGLLRVRGGARWEGGVKGQKMVQNHKRFCLLCSISQEPYILWFYLWCIHMCKMTMSPCVFLNFPGC